MINTTEEELQKILKSNKSKNIKINGKNYWISKKVKEEIRKKHRDTKTKGGFLPFLLPLIPGIIAGIAKVGAVAAGAAGLASGIAGVVSSSRAAQANELEKIKKQKEIQILDQQIATSKPPEITGSGVYLNPYKNEEEEEDDEDEEEEENYYLTPSQGTAIHKYLKNNSNIPKELTKKFKDGIEIESKGDGLYLNPYKK